MYLVCMFKDSQMRTESLFNNIISKSWKKWVWLIYIFDQVVNYVK